jgi:Tol biopolymer transport system component
MHKVFVPLIISLSFLNCKKASSENAIKIPPGNVVLYARSIGGGYANPPTGYGIYTNSDTGGSERPLIESNTLEFHNPNWAKNNRIYFNCHCGGERYEQIYSVNTDGTNIHRFSRDTGVVNLLVDISPYNDKLIYYKGNGNLYTNNLDGNSEKILAISGQVYSCHPNKNELILVDKELNSNGENVMNIYIINEDGSGKRRVTNNTDAKTIFSSPFISFDGSKIVYTSVRERFFGPTISSIVQDVYTCNIDGSNEQRITDNKPQTLVSPYNGNWSKESDKVIVIGQDNFRLPYSLVLTNPTTLSKHLVSTSAAKVMARMKQF